MYPHPAAMVMKRYIPPPPPALDISISPSSGLGTRTDGTGGTHSPVTIGPFTANIDNDHGVPGNYAYSWGTFKFSGTGGDSGTGAPGSPTSPSTLVSYDVYDQNNFFVYLNLFVTDTNYNSYAGGIRQSSTNIVLRFISAA